MTGTDPRVESIFEDVRRLQNESPAWAHDRTSFHLEELEKMFRDDEIEEPKKEEAGQRARKLFRDRVSGEIHKGTSEEEFWQGVLKVVDGPARHPRT